MINISDATMDKIFIAFVIWIVWHYLTKLLIKYIDM